MQGLGNAISFRLRGHTSNRDAIGAMVTVDGGVSRQTKFISAGSGFASQHTKELFFGVGDAASPVSISIRWPSGTVAHFGNLPVNHRVEIEEGSKEVKATPFLRAKSHEESPVPRVALAVTPVTSARGWLPLCTAPTSSSRI